MFSRRYRPAASVRTKLTKVVAFVTGRLESGTTIALTRIPAAGRPSVETSWPVTTPVGVCVVLNRGPRSSAVSNSSFIVVCCIMRRGRVTVNVARIAGGDLLQRNHGPAGVESPDAGTGGAVEGSVE